MYSAMSLQTLFEQGSVWKERGASGFSSMLRLKTLDPIEGPTDPTDPVGPTDLSELVVFETVLESGEALCLLRPIDLSFNFSLLWGLSHICCPG